MVSRGISRFIPFLLALAVFPFSTQETDAQEGVQRFLRFSADGVASYGVLEGGDVIRIEGDLFGEHRITGNRRPLSSVELLPPTDPTKVIAVGLNYRSHLGGQEPAAEPGLFAKYPTSLVAHGADIVRPEGARNLHYEGEMVLVIGKRASNVSPEEALDHVFGVTAGNDVSERAWQASDLQWLRAKASDSFGPVGPFIAVGLNPDDVLVETRVNGEVRQSERTSDLIFDVSTIISYVSRFFTLEPGDLIFTGTPGTTRAMQDGDVVEITVEGVGTIRNQVRSGG